MILAWDRSRYPRLDRFQIPRDETAVQLGVVATLEAAGVLAFPMDAGAAKLRGRAAAVLARSMVPECRAALHGLGGGAAAGLPDVLGVLRPSGRCVAVEVKRPELVERNGDGWRRLRAPGRVSADQAAWLASLERAGALVCVAWDEADVEELLHPAAGLPGQGVHPRLPPADGG